MGGRKEHAGSPAGRRKLGRARGDLVYFICYLCHQTQSLITHPYEARTLGLLSEVYGMHIQRLIFVLLVIYSALSTGEDVNARPYGLVRAG
jgi:hypothetical protein